MRVFQEMDSFFSHVQLYSFNSCSGPGSGLKPLSVWETRNPVCGHPSIWAYAEVTEATAMTLSE